MTDSRPRTPVLANLLVALLWLAVAGTVGGLIAYRAMLHSSIADLLEFRDVPLLQFVEDSYAEIVYGTAIAGAALVAACIWCLRTIRKSVSVIPLLIRLLPLMVLVFTGLGLWSCRFDLDADGVATGQLPTSTVDWLVVLLSLPIGWWLAGLNCLPVANDAPLVDPAHTPRRRLLLKLCLIYLCSLAGVVVYGVIEHLDFWHHDRNGGFDYIDFFPAEEIEPANIVMFTTTVLFASVAAFLGCLGFVAARRIYREQPTAGASLSRQLQWSSLILVVGWTLVLGLPWQIVILPEIRAEEGWILPATVLCMLISNLLSFISIAAVAIVGDVRRASHDADTARLSEILLWTKVLFPVYPLIRRLIPARTTWLYGSLMILSAALIAGFIAAVNFVDEWFEFEDWRGMLRSAQLPALQVYVSLLGSFWVYVACGRLLRCLRDPVARLTSRHILWRGCGLILRYAASLAVIVVAGACLAVASYPFWGWNSIPENVFSRLSEFNSRHEFELSVLHSILDCDRDGYAALLHGADTDDFNSDVQAGGLPAPRVVPLPLDQFVAASSGTANKTPNVLILYLEGVIPRAISSYGMRKLPSNRVATPHIDSVARDGTLFRQARCYYPSTWDAWFAVNTGRFLHVSEMNNSLPFGDRYTRYNNLYTVLQQVGVERWCHADCSCYAELFVPQEMLDHSKTAWQYGDDYSTSLSAEEEERDLWRGDKRNERMLKFLDDLDPSEPFFLCEHMSDSHFPWNRTTDERAREMGFADGLTPYEADATLPTKTIHSGRFARYLQTVTRVDWQIGQIIDKLKELDRYEDTLIVIVSDHGCQWWEHEHLYYVSHLYEQSLLVPMIVKLPGNSGVRGQENSDPVLHVDVLPTVMEFCGIAHDEKASRRPLDGVSLLPILEGRRTPALGERLRNRSVPLMTHYDTLGLIHEFRYKLIFDRPTGAVWLFNIEDDPMETRNLADTHPELLEEMHIRLRDYVRENPEFIGEIERSSSADSQ